MGMLKNLKDLGNIKDLKIGVLEGGVSSEREISLLSGKEAFLALKRQGLNVEEVVIDTDDPAKVRGILLERDIGIAFIALHGEFGEDGRVQEILESIKVPYTGSGPLASRRAMDKIISKRIFIGCGIPTPNFYVLEKGGRYIAPSYFPRVIKPYYSGSSIGVFIVNCLKEWEKGISEAFKVSDKLIIEDYIEGKELTVGILDDEALSVVEIIPKKGYFDFISKYSDGMVEFEAPARLGENVCKKIMEIAERAHKSLGCRHFSRVDIRLDRNNNPFVLEVNSIPGLTSHSLLPLSASVRGISFDELILRMIKLSLERYEEKAEQKV